MKFREFLGSIITGIGIFVMKIGAKIANGGFDLSNVSRERVVEVMTKMWAEDIKRESQVITTNDISEKEHYGVFVRADTQSEERS